MPQVTKRRRPSRKTTAKRPSRARKPARRAAARPEPRPQMTPRQRARVLAGMLVLMLVFTGWLGGFGAASVRFAERAAYAALVDAGFVLRHIDVSGLEAADVAAVRAALWIEPGEIIFNFDPAQARARLRQLDWVRDASVVRLLPNRIVVMVDERRPLAVWQGPDGGRVLDQEGVVIADADPRAFAHLPVTRGPGAPHATPELIAALTAAPDLADKVDVFEWVGARRWDAVSRLGARVRLPETSARDAIAKLAAFDAQELVLSAPVALIDLRGGGVAIRPHPTVFLSTLERGA